MASKEKNAQEADLVAIFRLEFYRKQRNWKFCKDVCKKREEQPTKLEADLQPEPQKPPNVTTSKKSMNQTYNICKLEEADNCEANISALNHAFLEEIDSDKSLPTTPPEPAAATSPIHGSLNNIPATACAEGAGAAGGVWARAAHAWLNVDQECIGPEAPWPSPLPGEPEGVQMWSFQHGWPELPVENTEGIPSVASWREEWVANSTRHTSQESVWSCGSASFLRGAAAAPHSSELQLPEDELQANAISCMSSQQLAAEVSRQAVLLRDLITEARRRECNTQRASTSLYLDERSPSYNLSCDDRPTRDLGPHPFASHLDLRDPPQIFGTINQGFNNNLNMIGPYSDKPIGIYDPKSLTSCNDEAIRYDPFSECGVPPYNGTFTYGDELSWRSNGDPFIAGSFKNVGEVGRGRGRLKKERVIGIGMGRPFRL